MTVWTDEMHNKLIECGRLGLCYREAARSLGVTRNAIAGKVMRLGITWNGQSREPYVKPKRNAEQRLAHAAAQRARRAKKPSQSIRKDRSTRRVEPMIMPENEVFPNGGCLIIDLSDKGCRWLSGSFYCGAVAEGRSSFCPKHNALAHRRVA